MMHNVVIFLLAVSANTATITENLKITSRDVDLSDTSKLECATRHHYCGVTLNPKSVASINCNCDENCHIYGDCCWNSPSGYNSNNNNLRKRLMCIDVGKQMSYLMVGTCLSTYQERGIIDLCEQIESSANDVQRVPVTSNTTNITYRNFYCAICNWDFLDVLSWIPEYACNEEKMKISKSGTNQSDSCPVDVCQPPKAYQENWNVIRRCESRAVANCSRNVDHVTKSKCQLFFAPVESNNTIQFKNKFCAFCNGQEAKDLKCTEFYSGGVRIVFTMFKAFSLKLLLDINFLDGGDVGSNARCGPNEVIAIISLKTNKNSQAGEDIKYIQETHCLKRFPGNEDHSNVDNIKTRDRSQKENIENENFHPYPATNNSRTMSAYSRDCKSVLLFTNYTRHDSGDVTIHSDDVWNNHTFSKGSFRILPNSSIFICLQDEPSQTMPYIQNILTLVCFIISEIALLMKIILHYLVLEPKTVPNRCVIMLSISLFSAQFLFMAGGLAEGIHQLCVLLACLIHYGFLASFCWMNVLAYDLFKTFSKNIRIKHSKRTFTGYCLYACLIPLFIVLISILFEWVFGLDVLRSRYGENLCWINNKIALLVFLAKPLAVILIANLFFFIVTAIKISRTIKDTKSARRNSTCRPDRVRFRLYTKLAFIMGLTWSFGFIAASTSNDIIWIIFIVLNGLEGTFIFIAFTDFRKVTERLQQRFGYNRGACTPETDYRIEENMKLNTRVGKEGSSP